ncbi:MAG: GNAT family N-acetyltransferase [Deltaproteobacteria bacterium]|nr:GNAT family N-acetyltransferase [Deltaproteobacteria bacterium]
MKWQRNNFTITDNRDDLDLKVIHGFLSNAYWAKGIPIDIAEKSIDNSLCFGLFDDEKQVGFGRAITDRATFAYMADVFVVESHRGLGLGKWLVSCILNHPDLQGLRRWILATLDAHDLYQKFGFVPLSEPERLMHINHPNLYDP